MELLAGTLLFLKLLPVLFVGGIFVKAFVGGGEQTIQDLLRHSYTIGETGTGKSTYCLNSILKTIKMGFGLLYIDIHGEDSRALLDFIPPEHADRVIYIDPTDAQCSIGFSLSDGCDDTLAVSALLSIFDTLWPGFIGPSSEDLLRMAGLAVLPNKGTLLELYQMLVDKEFRDSVPIKDDIVKDFWHNTFVETMQKDKSRLNPPTNKLRKLIMTPTCRLTLCQSQPKFDLMQAMKDNKIVICNFSKGKLGHDVARLFAALMFSKLWLNTFMRDENSVPYFVYLDEFQNYVTSNFSEILSEARKYSISLNLYHQYMKQIPEFLHHAIIGNVGSIYSFRVTDDCKRVGDMFDIEAEEIKGLKNFTCYAKRLRKGVKEKAQLIVCPPKPPKHGLSKQIIEQSKKYGYPPDNIMNDVKRRMGISPEKPFEIEAEIE
jgi:hypothetical protein